MRFKNADAPVNVIYSQWLGYIDGNHPDYFGSDKISRFRSDPAVNFVYAHYQRARARCRSAAVGRGAEAAHARSHSHRTRRRFLSIFANVVTRNDGESWSL